MSEILRSRTFQPGPDLTPLRDRIDGDVVGPGDYAWDEVRQAWNLSVDQRPAAVALPESPEDVMAIVAFASQAGALVVAEGIEDERMMELVRWIAEVGGDADRGALGGRSV